MSGMILEVVFSNCEQTGMVYVSYAKWTMSSPLGGGAAIRRVTDKVVLVGAEVSHASTHPTSTHPRSGHCPKI